MRLYLEHVTIAEAGTVKRLGARKDAMTGRWWIDTNWPDLDKFERWLPLGELLRLRERRMEVALERGFFDAGTPLPSTAACWEPGAERGHVVDIRYDEP